MKLGIGCVMVGLLSLVLSMAAQTTDSSPASAQVPLLVNFSGVLADVNGKPLTGLVGVTFLLYQEQQGGSPLWLETQNLQSGKTGNYTVALGSASSRGLPTNVFANGEARWLGVQVQGQAEQPRVPADERTLRIKGSGRSDSWGTSSLRLSGSGRRSWYSASA